MEQVYIDRFRILYAGLKCVPASKVDLENWRYFNGTCSILDEQLHDCGTTACAVGWACSFPELQEQGLIYKDFFPYYEDNMGWAAVHSFFGLTRLEADTLFSPFRVLDKNDCMVASSDSQWLSDPYGAATAIEVRTAIFSHGVDLKDGELAVVLGRLRAFAAWKGFSIE